MRAKLGKAPPVENAEPARRDAGAVAGRRRCGADGLATGGCRGGIRALPGRRDGDLRAAWAGCRRPGDEPGKGRSRRSATGSRTDPGPGSGEAIPSPSGRTRPKPAPALASVKAFIGERVSPADGERVEMKALVQEYRAWCAGKGSGAGRPRKLSRGGREGLPQGRDRDRQRRATCVLPQRED